jgi:hypothetical protein
LLTGLTAKSQGNLLEIKGEPLSAVLHPPYRHELLNRLFSISTLTSVKLNWRRGIMKLQFSQAAPSEGMEALAAAMHMDDPSWIPLANEHLLFTLSEHSSVEINRCESGITFWRVHEIEPNRFLLSHPLLSHSRVKERIMERLSSEAEVISQINLRGCRLEILCKPYSFDNVFFLEVLEPAIADMTSLLHSRTKFPQTRSVMLGANLALAPLSDFLFPSLGIFNATFVLLLNLPHIKPALRRLREGKTSLELLYICVAVLTLGTFRFFGAALMYTLLELWPHLSRRLRKKMEREFLTRYRRRPRRIWLDQNGILSETRIWKIRSGQIILLSEGEIVPLDGEIVSGTAEINETWITGHSEHALKKRGDKIYASSEVVSGEIRLRIDTKEPAANQLLRFFERILREPSPPIRAIRFANSMVFPALIASAAALSRGGLAMAKASLRPDYFCGPMMTEDLGSLAIVLQAATCGILVSDPKAIEKIAQADWWLFDDSIDWHAHDSEPFQESSSPAVAYFSSVRTAKARTNAEKLGFKKYFDVSNTIAKKGWIAQKQALGHTIVYFGDCLRENETAKQADYAVSVWDEKNSPIPQQPVVFLAPDLSKCATLSNFAKKYNTWYQSALTISSLPNFGATGAAIYLNTEVLTSVGLTAFGSFMNYRRCVRILKNLATAQFNSVTKVIA